MADQKETQPRENIKPQSLVKEADVKAALKVDKGSDAHLISWTVEDFTKQGDNYACVVSSVRVKFSCQELDAEVVYVVKLNPCRHLESFEELTRLFFRKEAMFYTTLAPELNSVLTAAGQKPLRVPRCVHYSLEEGREIIYLEDLRPRGFKMFDRRKGLDLPHVTLILQELGRLHASSFVLQTKIPEEELLQKHDYLIKDWVDNETISSVFERYFETSKEMLMKFEGYERAISWVDSNKLKTKKIFSEKLGSSKYNAICHGDCWNNNVLFRYNEEGVPVEVMLLDFQVVRRASPATDLNYLLYSSLTGEVRKPNVDFILASYHSALSTVMEACHMEAPFTRTELFHEFRDKNVLGVIFAMMLVPMILLCQEDVPDLSQTTDDEIEELMDELKAKTMKMLDSNPLMKPRFLSVFDEMMEAGVIS